MSKNQHEAVTYVFRWKATGDDLTCPICRQLHGREWRNQDLFQRFLFDPQHGLVWDLTRDLSMAHGIDPFHCRCNLEVDVNVDLDKTPQYISLADTLHLIDC